MTIQMLTASVFDDRVCQLGEGPLWHPLRQQLFWFDILGKRLLTRLGDAQTVWQFEDYVSAAGWVDRDTLLIASENGLYRFDIRTGHRDLAAPLEADNPKTRSNDGRADPWGGFWIGTMGIKSEPDAGAIYRFYRGELRQLFAPITISNSICFSPDRRWVYYCDTPKRLVMRQELCADDGWPVGDPSVFLDLRSEGLNADGSVVDEQGCLWNAQWMSSRIARYSRDGQFMSSVAVAGKQTTCPAFGGPDMTTLFATTAAVDLPGDGQGLTYAVDVGIKGQTEHQVIL